MSKIFKSKSGELRVVQDSELGKAAAQGMTLATPEEIARFQAGQQPGRAFLESGASTLSFGLADPLIKKLGDNPEAPVGPGQMMKLRQEENPAAALAGNVAGAAAGMLVPGGPVAEVARLGKAGAALAGGGVRGALAAGAIEGGLWGLKDAVTEATIENKPLTAEHAAAKMAGGALALGALSGGAKGAGLLLGAGASKLTSALGGVAAKAHLNDLAREAEWAALTNGLTGKHIAEIQGLKSEILDAARQSGALHTLADKSSPEFLAAAEGAREQVWNKAMGPTIEKAAARTPFDARGFLDATDNAVKQFAKNPVYDAAVKRVSNTASEAFQRQGFGWQEAWDLQSTLLKKLSAMHTTDAEREVFGAVRQSMKDFLVKKLAASRAVPEEWLARNIKQYAGAAALKDIAQAHYEKGLVGPSGGLFSQAKGYAVKAAQAAGLPTPTPGFLAGGALRELQNSGTLSRIATTFQQQYAQKLAQAGPMFLGTFGPAMAQAAARGADALLIQHITHASSAGGGEYLARMGMTPETPDEIQQVGRKAAVLDAIQGVSRDADAASAQAIDGFLGAKVGRPAAASPAGDVTDFEARSQKLRALLMDPSLAFASVPPEAMGAAPGITGQAVATILRAAQFLHERAPKDPMFGAPPALKRPWTPSSADLAKFYRYVDAVEHPGRVVERMKDGVVPKEHLEVLQVVYPNMYADLQRKLSARLAEWQKPLPYAKKLAISKILGPNVVGLSQTQLQVIQMSHAPQNAPPEAQGQQKKPDGRQQVDTQKNLETQGQRMEAR